ncbi:MAG: hypothetical protein ACKO91_03365 [Acidimicrobiales bacterium]
MLAVDDGGGFLGLGDNILPLLVLAIGGALAVGNVLAIVRPPGEQRDGELARAPIARSIGMAVIGAVAAIWATASLVG